MAKGRWRRFWQCSPISVWCWWARPPASHWRRYSCVLLLIRRRPFDGLSENAYGIYLVHYVFVIWLQFFAAGNRAACRCEGRNRIQQRARSQLGRQRDHVPPPDRRSADPRRTARPGAGAVVGSSAEPAAVAQRPVRSRADATRLRQAADYWRYCWMRVVRRPARPCWSMEYCQDRNSSTVSV